MEIKTMSTSNKDSVGVVIPTLGLDIASLVQAISSATKNNCVRFVVVVVPTQEKYLNLQPLVESKVRVIVEVNLGFAPAYNTGVAFLRSQGCSYYSVIGDDDELAYGYLDTVLESMEKKSAVAGFGHCYYINNKNEIIFKNPSPTWTAKFLHLIPDVLPAPGAIILISAWAEVGGLSCEYKFASDFDFWLKMRSVGKFCRVNVPMSYFRWHANGMTARFRKSSREEALTIQTNHTPRYQKFLIPTFTRLLYFIADTLMKFQMKESYDVKSETHG
jgi:GT2 family glycosyltransferase